jgi:hypothetical protein
MSGMQPTPRTLLSRELLSLFRSVGKARNWNDVDAAANNCVAKCRMAGFRTIAAVQVGNPAFPRVGNPAFPRVFRGV